MEAPSLPNRLQTLSPILLPTAGPLPRPPRAMAASGLIVGSLLLYMWVVVPALRPTGWVPALSAAMILGLLAVAVRCNHRAPWRGTGACWGLERRALAPGLGWAAALTVPAIMALLAAGWWLDTWQPRAHLAGSFARLLVWALVQQFLLQTVIFREARGAFGERGAMAVAAGLFALIHLPNPFLTGATFVAGLAWCWIYRRHPHLLPVALSHATASLAAMVALGPGITGGMRVGWGYFQAQGIWQAPLP